MWKEISQGESVMGESIDQFFIISEMIRHRLGELLPNFEPTHLEHKLFHVAIDDFLNYLRYIWSVQLQEWLPLDAGHIVVHDQEIPKYDEPNPNMKLRTLIFEWLEDDPKVAKEDLDIWLNLWLVKWRERVKILFGPEENINRNISQVETLIRKGSSVLGLQELKQFREPVLFTFLNLGEIAGTEILADSIIRKEAGRLRCSPKGVEEKVKFLNTCIREARNLSQVAGKFIFISVKDFKWGEMSE
jgi:hypothetical protein